MISDFIWNGGPVRIQKTFLQQPKRLGGFALPCFLFYYWAANIRSILYWSQSHYGLCQWVPAWVVMECDSCNRVSLHALLCSSIPIKFSHYSSNPLVLCSLKIWQQFRKHFGFQAMSGLSPSYKNPSFLSSISDGAFALWFRRGIVNINDLFHENTFVTFSYLSEKFNLPKTHFFRYLQTREFIRNKFSHFPHEPPKQEIDKILDIKVSKGVVANIYKIIFSFTSFSESSPISRIKQNWESDLNHVFTEEEWSKALRRVHTSSICACHSLIQFKLLHRIYWSKDKLPKINPDFDPTCDRCRQAPATLYHTFWLCPALTSFWTSIFKSISDVFILDVEPCPLVVLFGLNPIKVSLSLVQSNALAFCLIIAKRLILMNWKNPHPVIYIGCTTYYSLFK